MTASRISFTMTHSSVQDGIFQNAGKVDQSMRRLADGKRLTRPSDDSVGTSVALQLRSDLRRNEQYRRNIEDGQGMLTATENALAQTNNSFQRARELGIQGANDTYSPTDRLKMLEETRNLLEQIVGLANSTFHGDYIFAGAQTQKPPFDLRQGHDILTPAPGANGTSLAAVPATVPIFDLATSDSVSSTGNARTALLIPGSVRIAGLREGTDYTVDYRNGSMTFLTPAATAAAAAPGGMRVDYDWVRRSEDDLTGNLVREIAPGEEVAVNVEPDEAFGTPGGMNAFAAMISTMEGLQLNNVAKIRTSLSDIDTAFDRILQAQARAGSNANRLESALASGNDMNLLLTEQSSKVEDVDFAVEISEFQLRQQVYQASLQVGAKLIRSTLMDYL